MAFAAVSPTAPTTFSDAPARVGRMTVAECLTFERDAETRHEFIAGEVIRMAWGTPDHNRIIGDTYRALGNRLEAAGDARDAHISEQRVRVTDSGPFYYPDISVVCGAAVFDGDACLRNPHALIEVLSESTADDRDSKFRAYRRFASLRHYVLVAQAEPRVEHFERLPGDIWALVGEHESLADSLTFSDLGVSVPLAEIYRRVSFGAGGDTA
jgi:Uma2 family endonuclease